VTFTADNYSDKRQTRPLVREGAPQRQDRKCQTVINIWSCAPDGVRHQDWLTARQSQCDFDFDSDLNALLPCGGGAVEGNEKGNLESEKVKYCYKSHGTRTRKWLRWRGPAAIHTTDPSSHQRQRPISTSPQLYDSNTNLVVRHRWILYCKTGWPTDHRS
jgi:hypothetical protein